MNRGGERATVINDPARPADNKHETLPTRLSMKALKYIIVTSLLIVAFKFLLALNATMNGSYHASEVSRMVPFLFILALAAALSGRIRDQEGLPDSSNKRYEHD